MASIHFKDIQEILWERGHKDAIPFRKSSKEYFIEIRFDNDNYNYPRKIINENFKNEFLSVNSSIGVINIVFDENGTLVSLEIC